MTQNVIDTLQLDIIVNTKNNGQSVTTLKNSLEKLYKTLDTYKNQDLSKTRSDLSSLTTSLTKLAPALESLGEGNKNLTSLGTRLKTLNKRMGEIDAKAMAHKFDQMTQAITPFIDKVMSAQEALVALNNVMGGAKTLTKTATPKATTTTTPKSNTNTNILGGKLGKSLNFGSMIAKLYFVRNITKQLGQDLAKVVQYGIDYEETLNLWQVAMKGNTAEARKFITEMNRAYGISEVALMNYQATFKNMLSSLGGIEEAYGLSETLSQMALDYASLYNVSIESAMTKFQAVLAGQVRPIRNESGYDITQATLYEVYKSIGGTKSVRQLSETEKRLLRILAVYRQMKDTAVGDYAKTIQSTANQTRYMQETIKDIATWIGVGANQWLKQSNILIRINAYLIALKELAKSFAINMGYVEESEEKADDPLGDIEKEWDGINKQVDEYKGKLLGFDKFQVLTSADTGDGADISAELLKAMQEYEEILGKAQNIALFGDAEKNIKGAYDILKEWGYEYDEQSKQWLKDGKTVKENIEEIAKQVSGIVFTVGLLVNPWLAVLGAIEYCYWTNEDFKKSVNESFGRIKENAKGVIPLFTSIFEKALPLIEEIALFVLDIVDLISPLVEDILEPLAPIIEPIRKIFGDVFQFVKNIVSVLAPIISMIAEALNILTPILEIVHGITWVVSTVLSGAVQTVLWVLTPVLAVFEAILKVVESIGEVVRALFQWDWGSLGKNLSNIWTDWKIDDLATANNNMKWQPSWKADGGLATKGSLFYAGEAGPELVTQTSGGGSTIMNMKQLEDAVARGFIRGFASTDKGYEDTDETNVYVDGQRLFNIMRNTAKRNGYDFVRV